MAMETRLQLKQTQKLTMTPMLQQAIELLLMSRLELAQLVQQEMLENPLLEEVQSEEETAENAPEENVIELNEPEENEEERSLGLEDIDWENYFPDSEDMNFSAEPPDEITPLENMLKSPLSLTDHLLFQLYVSCHDPLDREIGTFLIGNIDEAGYLAADLAEVAEKFQVPVERVESVLRLIQTFDPTGVGARDLQECLLIQLRNQEHAHPLAERLIVRHLDQLEEHRLSHIAREEGCTVDEVIEAIKVIRQLDPKPGLRFQEGQPEYIVPDVFVVKMGEEYEVFLNDDSIPRLRINPHYRALLSQEGENDRRSTKQYLEEKFRSAIWLIKSIEQRRQTLLKVAKSLVKFQKEFLDKGLAYLKPLVLRDVAEDIGMHESTVSRVTTNKYMHTPQGVFEMKYFFHSGIESADGETMSSLLIKDKIKRLVLAEDPKKPLTDQQIVEMLKAEKINIARRTVAKYRQELHIPPANKRKRRLNLV
ncbi:MAG: RNA polymerase sigma-54 factor [Nitrospinota bacterium]|nr:MAG: RNA polymerase sigma-54 factor [Nitrospinota bacterium]